MVAELVAAFALIVAAFAELLHMRRVDRVARLAFGPDERPAPWAVAAPWLRALAFGALAWGLVTLWELPAKVHTAQVLADKERQHIVLVLDVSPSMRLVDAGKEKTISRAKRAAQLLESFFDRVPVERYLVSVIATYNGAKPVVVDTKDIEVVRNVLNDLPLSQAFPVGKTDLFSGLEEAAKVARPWAPKSTLVMMVTDGDTVPATGTPTMPASVSDVLVVGVGDSRVGSFIEGRQSRQDASTLRQMAIRLHGTYHDGNEKHLPTTLIAALTGTAEEGILNQLTRREYALAAIGLGGLALALLPWLLHHYGALWRPGTRLAPPRGRDDRATVG